MTTSKRKTNQLQLAIDFGGSMTKAIGGTSLTQRSAIAIEPDVIQIPSTLKNVNYLDNAQLEDRAWVGWDDQIYAVGFYAKTCSIANPQLSKLKREVAVYKVAAAIWIIQQRFNLPSHLKVNLACLLPVGEYEDAEQLKTQITEKLAEFETPTGMITTELRTFDCKPEGAGITMLHHRQRGESIKIVHLATIMVGYRNTSLMLFERGIRSNSRSSDLGFARLVHNVVSKTSGQNLERLTPAIAQYLANPDPDPKILHPVLLSENIEYELEKLTTAINEALEQYQLELSNWLSVNLPRSVTEVILSGGTADLFKAFFFEELQGKSVYLHAQVELPDDVRALNLGNRLADVWIFWDYFQQTLSKKSRQKVA